MLFIVGKEKALLIDSGLGVENIKKVVDKITQIAKDNLCKRVKVITINDNIHAIEFYQKRGFDMFKLYHNAVNRARQMKPSIPLLGDNNIFINHEIEFQFLI